MIDLKKNKTYCPYLFRGAVTSMPRLEIVPCCRYDLGPARQELGGEQMYPLTFDEGYDKMWKNIRKKSIKGDKIKGCWRCYSEEDSGLTSMRTAALQDDKEAERELQYYSPNDIDYTKPNLEFLEIQTGRFCNLKCRSCGPSLSTTWDEDLDKNVEVVKNFYGNNTPAYYEGIKLMPTANKELANISYDVAKTLKNIKATGGEPFLNDQFQVFLSNLIKWDLAKNIKIEVFTNCSFFPKPAFRKLLPKFKKVIISLSLDAVGDKAEFLRKGSIWSKVEDSASKWAKYCEENKQISLAISHTVTIYNVLYIKEFLDWMLAFFPKDLLCNKFSFDPNIATTPKYLAVSNHGEKVRMKILKVLTSEFGPLIVKHEKNKSFMEYIRRSYYRCFKVLGSNIENDKFVSWKDLRKNASKNKINLSGEFYEKAKLFDDVRNENWRSTFPELAEILNE